MRYIVDINASTCSEQVEVEADSIEDAIREAMRHGYLTPDSCRVLFVRVRPRHDAVR